MIIKKILFSGPKENNTPDEIVRFMKTDEKIEMGIYFTQYSAKGNSRYDWVKEFSAKMKENNYSATLQLGYEWCEDFCNGIIADEIKEMLDYTTDEGKKVFKSVQLNFMMNQQKLNQETLMEVIKNNPAHRFILSYNTMNKEFIDGMTFKGIPFDVLYKPFSEMETLKNNKDFFADRTQGYSGEFCPSDIKYQLDKIASSSLPNSKVYIDLYKVLFDEDGNCDLSIAADFMGNINSWISEKAFKKMNP